MPTQRYGEHGDGISMYWEVARIWRLAGDLPVEEIAIDEIRGPDEVTWFSREGPLPTCRAIAEHCRRINAANLDQPVVLTQDRRVFDGMHRIAKCLMLGRTHVLAKRFSRNPEPDEVVADDDGGHRRHP